jgi:hypothetical protein
MRALSASTLKLFQECPRCFWRHVNQKLQRPRGPFPSLPTGIDRVLKGYFDRYRRQGTLPPLIAGKLDGALANSALTLGFDDQTLRARLWGKLDDCVLLPDGRLSPLDHKTRASAPGDLGYTERYYQLQMDVYTLLLERAGHRVNRTAYVVYYFPIDGALHEGFPFDVAVHRIATDPQRAHQVFAEACRCLEEALPSCGQLCQFCRWVEACASSRMPTTARDHSAAETAAVRTPPAWPQRPPQASATRRATRGSSTATGKRRRAAEEPESLGDLFAP